MVDYLKIAREAGERRARSNGEEESANRTDERFPMSEDTSGCPSDDTLRAQSHESHEDDVSRGEGAEDEVDAPSPFEDAALTHIVGVLDSLLKEEPEYASEREPEVLINAVASRPEMVFVPTLAEMTEAMKIVGLKPSTVSDAEVTIRRLLRAPLDESGGHNLAQLWVGNRGRMFIDYPDFEYVSTSRVASDLRDEAYFVDDTSNEEVAEVLDKLVKEQKRANLRKKKHQRTRAARKSATNDSSAGSHQEDDYRRDQQGCRAEEEVGRTASERMAKSQGLHHTTVLPVHREPNEGPVDQVHAEDRRVERDDAGTDVHEAEEPEIDTEVVSEEPAGPHPHGGSVGESAQVTRVAEVLREHRERCTSDADDLIQEGFFHDKLDFEPTSGIVEKAQCMLLLPEE